MNVRIQLAGLTLTLIVLFLSNLSLPAADEKAPLRLTLRSRTKGDGDTFTTTEKKVAWEPKKTALIICDMWDDHWCKSAAGRVGSWKQGPLMSLSRRSLRPMPRTRVCW